MKTAKINTSIKPIAFHIIEISMVSSANPHNKTKEKLSLKVGHVIQRNPVDNKMLFVDFITDIENKDQSFKLLVKYRSTFVSSIEITDDFLNSPFIQQSPPAIAYPYLRAFIMTLTSNAGINTIVLPPLNFTRIKDNCEE